MLPQKGYTPTKADGAACPPLDPNTMSSIATHALTPAHKPPAKQAQRPTLIVMPTAGPSTRKRRHTGSLASFFGFVALPVCAAIVYLWMFAADQYASVVGFAVRQEDRTAASGLLGGLARFAGTSTSADGDILYAFIQSQEIVEAIDRRVDLRGHYAQNWPQDPIFALWPGASIEDLLWIWQRKITVSYNQSTQLTELRVLANSPQFAQTIAQEILAQSQAMINNLNATARDDVMRNALLDLDVAQSRLKAAREALTAYRVQTQIVDPAADIQGRIGVLHNLQQQLVQTTIDYDILLQTMQSDNPRLREAQRRIDVIRSRIAEERRTQSSTADPLSDAEPDYPSLIAEFERMAVDLEFAEQTYRAALAAVDIARSEASRQSRYLAAYITPTLPQTAEYPQRFLLTGLIAMFLGMAWSVLMLIYYSIRDRR